MAETQNLPLFPLNAVLFPNMPLPLHVFEPRYKKMINDCLKRGSDFGVIFAQSNGMAKVGTSARIENVLQTFDDGRMNILTLGQSRFKIGTISETSTYLTAQVEFWDDDNLHEDVEDLFQKVRTLLKDYARLTGKISDSAIFENYTAYSFSFFLAEINMYSLPHQQQLLELRSTRERLEKGLQSLEFLLGRLKLDKKLQKILGTRQTFFNIYN
jgi:Lon protease-like protein